MLALNIENKVVLCNPIMFSDFGEIWVSVNPRTYM
jgi:hypothetical protein